MAKCAWNGTTGVLEFLVLQVESSRIAQFMELLAALKEADRCLAMVSFFFASVVGNY